MSLVIVFFPKEFFLSDLEVVFVLLVVSEFQIQHHRVFSNTIED